MDVYRNLLVVAANVRAMQTTDSRAQTYVKNVGDLLKTLRDVSQEDGLRALTSFSNDTTNYELAQTYNVRFDTQTLFETAQHVRPDCRRLFAHGLWVGFRNVDLQVSDFSLCNVLKKYDERYDRDVPVALAHVNGGQVLEARINGSPEFMLYGIDMKTHAQNAWWLVQGDDMSPRTSWVSRDWMN